MRAQLLWLNLKYLLAALLLISVGMCVGAQSDKIAVIDSKDGELEALNGIE